MKTKKSIQQYLQVFENTFQSNRTKYKFALIGYNANLIGWETKWNLPSFKFDYFLNEAYTEGSAYDKNVKMDFYEPLPLSTSPSGTKSTGNATCPSMSVNALDNFWTAVATDFGMNTAGSKADMLVPTVCGSGNCQENSNFIDSSGKQIQCFDERLSNKFIGALVNQNKSPHKNVAIWYGTGSLKNGFCNYGNSPNWGCANMW